MPKVKRRPIDNSNVLCSRDVSKIRKLMRDNFEEERSVASKSLTDVAASLESESNSEESEVEEELQLDLPDFNSCDDFLEGDEDWKKFFKDTSENKQLVTELKINLAESKLKISEDMSQYTGSVIGDLDEVRGLENADELPDELRDHLNLLIDVLRHYRSGLYRKTVKMLPHLVGWDSLLEMLKPLEWSVHVYPRSSRYLHPRVTNQHITFYESYLLPKVKQDIKENRRLCFHLFEALIASMFRPEEFISGVYLPWVQSEMSKTEGIILSNLIKRATLKSRFAAVALALTLEEDFSIPRSMVVETFIAKKYHLPEAAVLRIINYFISFDKDCTTYFTDEKRMPLTWFKSLLVFLEFYRHCVNPSQREKLLKLCRRHEHPEITPEIRSFLGTIPIN
uniref:SJCHGC09292 protein n=1 Tax=Schistosoma japonicum TaxID=6182 RepID=Q5DFX9_SCHJA|nr:SJCHGC09292 protein [Schistosoma japonicum]